MTLLDRLLGRSAPAPRAAKAVTALGPWGTGAPISSIHNTPQERAAAYLRAYRVGWFYKAGRKISDDFASLPWSVADGDADSEDPAETELDRPDLDIPFDALSPIDQFQRLMEKPNPGQTGRHLRRAALIRRDFGGVGFLWLQGGDVGLPTAIYGISPTRMTPSYGKGGALIGWVLDIDSPSGGTPFSTDEILAWSSGGPDFDPGHPDYPFGPSVVEAVAAHVPLPALMANHAGTVLTLGGRLAGMVWPKERSLNEDEYNDVVRAWRNVAADPQAAKRLLVFPEPMEWQQGAATPDEIGIPELGSWTRDEVLTAFPISPYRLGVPSPGGLNSGEVRREDRQDYWEETIGPRREDWDEFIAVNLLARYEREMGQTFKYRTKSPSLDDAPALLEKAGAFKSLVSIGFDAQAVVSAVGLQHIKWNGLPTLLDPEEQARLATEAHEESMRVVASDGRRTDPTSTQQTLIGKAAAPVVLGGMKARADVARAAQPPIAAFLTGQRDRVVERIRATYPDTKADRRTYATKADPEWWDAAAEDLALREALRRVYIDAGREGLQVVADGLGRIVPNKAVDRVIADLVTYGGQRIADINARTLQSIVIELATGTKRGYSVAQLIDGVPDEGFRGVRNVGLDNGIGAWDELRAETIARTETALSYNRAALSGYAQFDVARVVAFDGDGDPDCAARNGHEYPIDEAMGIADHPNGTLDWAPVV